MGITREEAKLRSMPDCPRCAGHGVTTDCFYSEDGCYDFDCCYDVQCPCIDGEQQLPRTDD